MYHVMTHAIAGSWLFLDDADYRLRLGQFADAVRRGEMRLHAYCLMGNHEEALVTGKQAFAGALELEAKLTDAASGQLLSAVVARGVGGGSMKAAAQWKWGDAENAIDLFSKRAASNLHALTTGRATPAELPLPD